jgi:subtilisin family serine protease
MRRHAAILLSSLLVLMVVAPAAGAAPETVRVILTFEHDLVPAATAASLARANGGTVAFVYDHALNGAAIDVPSAAVASLSNARGVLRVELDGPVTTTATQSSATWGLDRIDQRDLPLSNSYTYTPTGTGVTAYIVDTGILPTHADLKGRVLAGFTAINDGRGSNDCNGHGTHVAGTVGGTTYGVAKQVTLVPVRVLNCQGSGTWSGVIAGLDWIAQQEGGKASKAVANMSLGGGASSSVDDAVQRVIGAGVTVAVAAGNSSANACNYSPARAPNALTVGATGSTDAKASYSNFGTCLDLFAPGSSITSAWHTGDTAINTISGTSMASPHVAGVAALLLQGGSASPASIASTITSGATTNKVTSAGTGSPNRLLYSLLGTTTTTTTNQAPVASFTHACTDLVCNFTSTSSDSDGNISAYSWSFGDSSSSTIQNPSKTYSAGGSYTVSLTVTDNAGAKSTATRTVSVTATSQTVAPTIVLSVAGKAVKGGYQASLSWSGATGSFDVFRNGTRVTTVSTTSYTDRVKSGTYTYKVCLAGTTTCSNEAAVTF